MSRSADALGGKLAHLFTFKSPVRVTPSLEAIARAVCLGGSDDLEATPGLHSEVNQRLVHRAKKTADPATT